jgi:hypothetical protein
MFQSSVEFCRTAYNRVHYGTARLDFGSGVISAFAGSA